MPSMLYRSTSFSVRCVRRAHKPVLLNIISCGQRRMKLKMVGNKTRYIVGTAAVHRSEQSGVIMGLTCGMHRPCTLLVA